ncbi:MAG: response regulator, partial [Gammaproteobacteria bacterium]|nr:response regulator [Gammaproteobacteria bacterium]
LDGFEEDWSAWSIETDKDYTNLWEGEYIFYVQARDVYGFISREDAFSFQILPPWYRTWWTYLIYCLAFAALLAAYVRSIRKKLHHERAVSKRLREVDRLKDEFLANTSHELRTPLYGMIGLVEALLNKSLKIDPEDRNILNVVLQSGQRLSKLVADILDFSKLKHQSLELALEPVELHSLVDVVLTICKPMISGKNIELVNAIAPDCPPIQADEARIEQILHNLVGNAIKFTEQGKIEVSAKQQKNKLLVRVSDTGIGIAAEQQEKIFDFFVQADSSTQREYGGTGLGLAVSRQLVELHNGHINVESAPGEGSTFSFTLQIAKIRAKDEAWDGLKNETYERIPAPEVVEQSDIVLSEDLPEQAEVQKDSKADLSTILFVDDEPVVHQVLKLHLASKSFRLLSASNGPQALNIIERNKVDLVLLDIMMPRMTGYEVCRTIRKTNTREELPIIFLSAKDRSRDRVASFDEGGNDYLIKPIGRNELLIRVDTQLEMLNVYRDKEEEIHLLQDILPICSWCKKIRDDQGFWSQLEAYFYRNSDVKFSHGICPDCMKK